MTKVIRTDLLDELGISAGGPSELLGPEGPLSTHSFLVLYQVESACPAASAPSASSSAIHT